MSPQLKQRVSRVLLLGSIPFLCIGGLFWYRMTPSLPVPPDTINFRSGGAFSGPDHQNIWIAYEVPTSREAVITFYQQQGAQCEELDDIPNICVGKTFLGRAEYRILSITSVSDSRHLTRVEANLFWSSF